MSTYLTYGIVLAKEDFKDYDIRYTIYTNSCGKVSAIAKGAKKITSKLNPHLEFFSVSKLMIANGKSFKRIAGAQNDIVFDQVMNNLDKRIIALYFFEAVNLLVKYDFEDEFIFELLGKFLTILNRSSSKQDSLIALNKFLYSLLEHLGYKPEIKSLKQRGLIVQFNKLIMIVTEKEMKSYHMLLKFFDK